MKQKGPPLDPVVHRLKAWRDKNSLSQRQAAEVIRERGLPLTLRTLQAWEGRQRHPDRWKAKVLDQFLEMNKEITDPPKYAKSATSKFSEADLTEIHRLRKQKKSLAWIGGQFGVDQSYISRILRGERLKN